MFDPFAFDDNVEDDEEEEEEDEDEEDEDEEEEDEERRAAATSLRMGGGGTAGDVEKGGWRSKLGALCRGARTLITPGMEAEEKSIEPAVTTWVDDGEYVA